MIRNEVVTVERFRPVPFATCSLGAATLNPSALWWFDNAIPFQDTDEVKGSSNNSSNSATNAAMISLLPWTGHLVFHGQFPYINLDADAAASTPETRWYMCQDPAAICHGMFKKLGFQFSKQNLLKLAKQYPFLKLSLAGHPNYRALLNSRKYSAMITNNATATSDDAKKQANGGNGGGSSKKRRHSYSKNTVLLPRVRLVSRKQWLDYVNHWNV